MSEFSEVRALLNAAITEGAGSTAVLDAVRALQRLARQAYGEGNSDAYRAYHALMYEVHRSGEPESGPLRRWMAFEVCKTEEQFIPKAAEPRSLLPQPEFVELLRAEQVAGPSKSDHPLAKHLFSSQATSEDLRIYLRDLWHRARGFYHEWADFCLCLRIEHPDEAVKKIYEILSEEVGGHSGLPHSTNLRNILTRCGIKTLWYDLPPALETQVYLNNRSRCLRHPRLAWGLGLAFAMEKQTLMTFAHLSHALHRLLGLTPQDTDPHFGLHQNVDSEHALTIAEVAAQLLHTTEEQQLAVASLRWHMQLAMGTMEPVWRQIQAQHTAAAATVGL